MRRCGRDAPKALAPARLPNLGRAAQTRSSPLAARVPAILAARVRAYPVPDASPRPTPLRVIIENARYFCQIFLFYFQIIFDKEVPFIFFIARESLIESRIA